MRLSHDLWQGFYVAPRLWIINENVEIQMFSFAV